MEIKFDYESSDKLEYSIPGVYSVRCYGTDLTLFGESENVYETLSEIYHELLFRTSKNEKMLADYKESDDEAFEFQILEYGPLSEYSIF